MTNITDEQINALRYLLDTWATSNEVEFDDINYCPICGDKVMYYYGAGFKQIVCSNKCHGMKIYKTMKW